MKQQMIVNSKTCDPQTVSKIIEELSAKGFYSNGYIECDDSKDREVVEILDRYLINQ